MEEKVLKTINKYSLIAPGDTVILGLSGGADSVSLLLSLLNLKDRLKIKKIIACHINHNLRENAKRDEEFSRNLCKKYGVDFYLKSVDIKKIKNELKLSEEDAGRQVRYSFFNEIRELSGGGKIATAHNLNDQAETFFMRLLRGASPDGLLSVKPLREDGVIRPLIAIKREEIEAYLKEKKQDFITDETNFEEDYLRNKIRLSLIPVLKEKFSFKEEILSDTLELLRNDCGYIKEETEKITDKASFGNGRGEISLEILKGLHASLLSRVVRNIVKEAVSYNLSGKETERIIELVKASVTGKKVTIGKEAEAYISYQKFVVTKKNEYNKYSYPVLPGENAFKSHGFAITLCENNGEKDGVLVEDAEGISVRTRLPGDKVYIKNLGHKKLQDLFTDKKVPKEQRDIYPVVIKGDKIIWVPGLYKRCEKDRLTVRRMKDEK